MAPVDPTAAQTDPDLSLSPLTDHSCRGDPEPQLAITTLEFTADLAGTRHSPSRALVTVPTLSLVTTACTGSIYMS